MALLKDILYEEEKERIAGKYRTAILRIGEAVKFFKPRQKAILLDALKQSGFSKDDLRERGWMFSTHLWNSSSFVGFEKFPVPPEVLKMGSKKGRGSKPQVHRGVLTETSFSKKRRWVFEM